MDRDTAITTDSDKVGTSVETQPIGIVPTPSRIHARYGSYSRHASTKDGMSAIPESEEANFVNFSSTNLGEATPLHQTEPASRSNSPSLLRRITTRLKNPINSSPVGAVPSIPMNPLRSLRKSRRTEYENLRDYDEEGTGVNVDLSLISGLGFEFTEGQDSASEPWLDQDTSYQGNRVDSPKPDFQSFVRRRQLGDGLVVGAKLKRDPSVHQTDTPEARADEIKRSTTVRKTAQDMAQKRNMIVAVSEPVDLSFFEGHVMRHQTSQNFDTMLNRAGTMVDQPESYFFPPDPDIPNWRPKTMSTPFILFLIAGALGLAGSQEYLCQTSRRLNDDVNKAGILAFDDVDDVPVGIFFVWKYLPTMVTIIYAVFFSVMDFDIRRLEPFYQLSQPQGSPASESLNVDHLTMFQYLLPFKAFRLRQWTVFFSTIGNIIASTASPALQNPSVDFNINDYCKSHTDVNGTIIIDCPPNVKKYVVVIVPIWSRLLSASYLVVGLIAIILFFQLRRKSGLLSDPKGIAGIASMATKSHILRDFKGTDLATRQDIQNKLAHRRFVIYKSSIWQGQWSLNDEPQQETVRRLSSPHPPMLRMAAAIPFVLAQVFCLVAVPIISLTRANAIPNAAPWLPILVATILKLVWSTFEADVRLMEPFYQLSRGNAAPENSLTLDYQSTVYGFLPFKAAFNRHWLLCLVGLCSMSLDMLSVTVSSFSIQADMLYNQIGKKSDKPAEQSAGPETMVSFFASVSLSVLILTFVIFTTVLVYVRRRHPFLPREPSTIASVLAFIYASNMLEDFIGTETLTNKQMEQRLKKIGKRYALGWFKGRDGQIHCAIDQEPLRSKYIHGSRYDHAMAGPVDEYGVHYV